MDDIVVRLEREAGDLSLLTCNCTNGLHAKDCRKCVRMKLLFEAAREIEELRSLYTAVKK